MELDEKIPVKILRRLVEEAGGISKFARKHSKPDADKPIDETFVSQILNGHREFGEKARRNMERRSGLPYKFFEGLGNPQSPLPTPTDDEFALVQQLDMRASCGKGRFEEHIVIEGGLAFKRSALHSFGVQEHNARIVYAEGTSMEPTIGHGRVVLINLADTEAKDGKVYLICDPDGQSYLKRLVRDYDPQGGGMIWFMRSDNTNKLEYPDKRLPDDERTRVIGRAVWNDNTL